MIPGILFVDMQTPKPYDLHTLTTGSLGGTEATVIRIAEKLSEKVPVYVAQHNRKQIFTSKNVTYTLVTRELYREPWQAIVVNRNFEIALQVKEQMKNTPVWLWTHDLSLIQNLRWYSEFVEKKIGIIAVSDYLKGLVGRHCAEDPYFPNGLNIVRIYNPIADDLKPDSTAVDRNKLIFVSSYHKGLEDTVHMFQHIRRKYPVELCVTNPSYHHTLPQDFRSPYVTYLGPVTHAANIQLIRSAFCVFYMNHVAPETFGIVLAEANAVGTPVLTHPLGAAPEVLLDHDQLVNTHNKQEVQDRLSKWYEQGRLQVTGRDEFRISNVIKDWEKLLLV